MEARASSVVGLMAQHVAYVLSGGVLKAGASLSAPSLSLTNVKLPSALNYFEKQSMTAGCLRQAVERPGL